ncbi:MAG: hypothetical protein JSV91_04435 [Phycisphaerales bacterium]|nr:MAG: hypothetical protein JSV91_04435 [Phycisphaerales bacterium]
MTERNEDKPIRRMRANAGWFAAVLIIAGCVLAALTLAAIAIFQDAAAKAENARVGDRYTPELTEMKRGQAARLEGPSRWEIRSEGVRSLVIPIDEAVEAVIREAAQESNSP